MQKKYIWVRIVFDGSNSHRIITLWLFTLLFLFISNYIFAEEQRGLGYIFLWDDLESKSNWTIDAGNMNLSTYHTTEGQSSLKVTVGQETARDLSKGIVLKKEKAILNIENAKGLILDIYNEGEPFKMVLAFYTNGLHESFPKRIESGLNKNVVFDLGAENFSPPFGLENIAQSLSFIIYPEKDTLNPVYIDNIRIHQYGGIEFTPGFSPTVTGMVAEGYTPPETPPVEHLYRLPGWTTGEETPPPIIYEPKTLFLLGTGLVGLVFYQRKGKKPHK